MADRRLIDDDVKHLYFPVKRKSDRNGDSLKLASKPEELWSCTTCAACVEQCPVTIEHIDKNVDMRRYLTMQEAAAPPEAQRAMTTIERAGNPWGAAQDSRADWAGGVGIPPVAGPPEGTLGGQSPFIRCKGCLKERQANPDKFFGSQASVPASKGEHDHKH